MSDENKQVQPGGFAEAYGSETEELTRLRAFAEYIVKLGHWEAGCVCGDCMNASRAESALGRKPRVKQWYWGIAEGPDD